jgi:hypothetical protein
MVQNLWTGGFASNDGIKAVAATNLKRARLADYKVVAYANTSPPDWWSLKIQMDNIISNAGAEWASIEDVVIDVEIPGITQARVFELEKGLVAAGKNADVLYTAYWFWKGHMGNSQDIAWRRFRLWPADYDGDPTIDWPKPFGPWKLDDLIGKQYAGTTYIEGQAIDLNTFKDSWMEDDMGMTVEEAAKLASVEEAVRDLRQRVGYEAHIGNIFKFAGILTTLGRSDPLPVIADLRKALAAFEAALKSGQVEQ